MMLKARQKDSLPKSLTTTMLNFDGKSERFNLFEDLFQTSLKTQNQLTEEDNNYLHSHTWRCAANLQKQQQPERRKRGRNSYCVPSEIRETPDNGYGKTQISTTNLQTSGPKLIDFLDKLQKLTKDAFGVAAQAIFEQFIRAKMPSHLKNSINQANLEKHF